MCTLEEIAGWFDCSVDTIERACKREKKLGFAEYYRQKSKKGHVALRRVQMQKALDGNPTLLIWMGKQYLDQKDKTETDLNHTYEPLVIETSKAILTVDFKGEKK